MGIYPPILSREATLVGILPPLYTLGGYPGGYVPIIHPGRATLVGKYLPNMPLRIPWVSINLPNIPQDPWWV